jgi:polyisoprenoid-binding protein YceI
MIKSALICSLLLAVAPAFATDYAQAPGSSLAFAGTYQGEAFAGRFPGFTTRLSFDPQQLATAKLDVNIPLASATTANADYDASMRGKDFFVATKFPQAPR